MSRVFVCLFVLVIFSIAVQFGDCENNTIVEPDAECEDVNIAPGSDKTRLSNLEKLLKGLKWPIDAVGNFFRKRKDDSQSKDKGTYGNFLEKISYYNKFIVLGTLWCGSGDIARDEKDLGIFKRTDTCCRAHDKCKNDILAGNTKVNLQNNGFFTRSSCTCDWAFHNCLKDAKNPIAFKIGVTYFNILNPQCFRCVCPAKDCDPKDGTDCKDHCEKYEWVNNRKYV